MKNFCDFKIISDKGTNLLAFHNERAAYDLNPRWQREFVWSDSTKSSFLDLVYRKLSIPTIYFVQNGKCPSECLDGKQRLTTLLDFMDNKFKIKNVPYVSPPLKGKKFKNLEKSDKDRFSAAHLPIIELDFSKAEQPRKAIADLFQRINEKTNVTNAFKRRALFLDNQLFELIRNIANTDEFLLLLSKDTSHHKSIIKRAFHETCALAVYAISHPNKIVFDDTSNSINNFILKFLSSESEREISEKKIQQDFRNFYRNHKEIFDTQSLADFSKGSQREIYAGIFPCLMQIRTVTVNKNKTEIQKFVSWIVSDESTNDIMSEIGYNAKKDSKNHQYIRQVYKKCKKFFDDLESKQGFRNFSSTQKKEIEKKSERPYTCGICNNSITGKYEFDHIVPWNKGGQTSVENGQIVHPACNRSKQDNK